MHSTFCVLGRPFQKNGQRFVTEIEKHATFQKNIQRFVKEIKKNATFSEKCLKLKSFVGRVGERTWLEGREWK